MSWMWEWGVFVCWGRVCGLIMSIMMHGLRRVSLFSSVRLDSMIYVQDYAGLHFIL